MKMINKPRVTEKFHAFHKAVRKNDGHIGTNVRILDFSYHNVCNFNCEHCFTLAPEHKDKLETMPLEKIKQVADEADELGVYEFDLQGGELLLFPDKLFQLLEAIGPERFYVYLTTNGYFMTPELAKRLLEAGVDRVSVSIDSINPQIHDQFRGVEGAHEKALNALKYVQDAGIDPFLNVTVGHYNAFDEELEELLQYSLDQGYTTVINAAIPSGCWEGNEDIILNQQDRERLQYLREKYQNIIRDIWNPFDRKEHKQLLGCNAVNRMYMTPTGDILACPFMQVKIGNVFEQSLKEIVEYGFSIKYFSEFHDKCLAGEDIEFMSKYLSQPRSVREPLDAKKIF
jgi:MoaA/NifB/PqqE/SkfB family radical SAM enzyme